MQEAVRISTAKRAGKQPLQSFNFVPAFLLSSLDDTRLHPSDATLAKGPINPIPCVRFVGGCTRAFGRVHLLFPPSKVMPVLSPRMTDWKSARLRSRVIRRLLSTRLRSGICFFQFPLPGTPTAVLAETLAHNFGRDVGVTRLDNNDTNELAPVNTPAVLCVRVLLPCGGATDGVAFWLKPISAFGLLGP